jgi:hypothetical protein
MKAHMGDLSVVYLPNTPPPERDQSRIEFEPGAAYLLNRGTGTETMFIFGGASAEASDDAEVATQRFGYRVQHDEAEFLARLEELPAPLRNLGKSLLAAARELAPRDYLQRTSTGRYVNRPDNFWTVKIQPRDGSFRVTVRGRPDRFDGIRGLEVKPDQNGYSSFKISSAREVESATAALKRAKAG